MLSWTTLSHTSKLGFHQNWKVHFLPPISCLSTPPSFQKTFPSKLNLELDAFLPHPSSFENEITTWKLHMAEWPHTDIKVDLLSTCNFAQENQLFYPNIHTILPLLCLPVGSCPCERSSSVLRPGVEAQ